MNKFQHTATGRFDNAPSHLIIISEKYAVVPAVMYDSSSDDEYYAKKMERELELERLQEARDRAALERAVERNRARKEKEAEERRLREEKSRKAQEEAKSVVKKPKSNSPLLHTMPRMYHRKPIKPDSPSLRPKPQPFVPPEGFVRIGEIKGMTIPGIIIAIKKGYITAMKHSRLWYVNKEVADSYIAETFKRKRENSLVHLATARAVRASKRASNADNIKKVAMRPKKEEVHGPDERDDQDEQGREDNT